MYKSLFLPVFLLFLAMLPVASASCAPLVSFTIAPMTTELALKPGEVYTGVIAIKNETFIQGQPCGSVHLKIAAMDWTLTADGTPQFQPASSQPGSCCTWMQFNPTETTVAPGQTQLVRYTLTVPVQASGAFHSVLMFQSAPEPSAIDGHAVSLTGQIGAILYVQVGPQVKRLRVTSFHVTTQNARLGLENTGNSPIRLKGTLQITDASGKTVYQMPLPAVMILPDTDNQRLVKIDFPAVNAPGELTATVLIDYGADALLGVRAGVDAP